jgi:hypothetical protein
MEKIIWVIYGLIILLILFIGFRMVVWINRFCDRITKPKCHICESHTEIEWVCEKCDEYYCEDCCAPFNMHTQIDYNCCERCSNIY